jgi:hypothetical protein
MISSGKNNTKNLDAGFETSEKRSKPRRGQTRFVGLALALAFLWIKPSQAQHIDYILVTGGLLSVQQAPPGIYFNNQLSLLCCRQLRPLLRALPIRIRRRKDSLQDTKSWPVWRWPSERSSRLRSAEVGPQGFKNNAATGCNHTPLEHPYFPHSLRRNGANLSAGWTGITRQGRLRVT